jgi:hypothetical protein
MSDVPCKGCQQFRFGETIHFIRYGKFPASGTSYNYRDNKPEAGISVYEIVDGNIQFVGGCFGCTGRRFYLGDGIIVGWGSDGEPLVKILTIHNVDRSTRAGYTKQLARYQQERIAIDVVSS